MDRRRDGRTLDTVVLSGSGVVTFDPSLPCASIGNWSQPKATVLACLAVFAGRAICRRLRPLGPILGCPNP